MKDSCRRFLLVRTDRIGDVILSTPAITAIRNAEPDAFIAMLVAPYTHEIVLGHPHLNETIVDDQNSRNKGIPGFFNLVKKLKSYRFDVVFFLHPTARLALAGWLARIPARVGTRFRVYSILFNKPVNQHRKKSSKHELDLNLELLASLGFHLDSVSFFIDIPRSAEKKVETELAKLGSQDFVVIHPGSGGSALDWPPEKFGQLGSDIQSKLKLPVIVTGSKNESEIVHKVIDASASSLCRMDGIFSLKELAALFRKAKLVVANSTGPLHLARAVETDIIGLYCPLAACLPQRWGPYNRPDSVIMPNVKVCNGCHSNKCGLRNCMETISVNEVFDKVKEKLSANPLR